MPIDRREFLVGAGALAAASRAVAQEAENPVPDDPYASEVVGPEGGDPWAAVRAEFLLDPDYVHMAAMLLASHPRQVRDAIEHHRHELDLNPVTYLEENNGPLRQAAVVAAASYLGVETPAIALTDSTTMGLGLVYNGLRLHRGQEILSTYEDYYVTHEATRLAAMRSGASVRRISLYEEIDAVTGEALVDRIGQAITPQTRVLALTWVHSSTGLKLPVRAIADALAAINASRDEADQILFVLDGVHGFGNQDVTIPDLGCDVFIAGCHKWLFGPRGTGLVAVGERGWLAMLPTIPSFIDDPSWNAWQMGEPGPNGAEHGSAMTPGGFKAYEHKWALGEAFAFNTAIGKDRIAARTAELATALKEGLAAMPHVRLWTPMGPDLSAGIVSFDVDGYSPENAVEGLRERNIIGSVAPYKVPHVRLTPSIVNSPADVDRALAAVATLT